MQFSNHTKHLLVAIETMDISDGQLRISDPLVMASAAGWYIGQVCREATDCDGMIMPWDRLTGYMSEADAIAEWDRDFKEDIEDVFCDVCGEYYTTEDPCQLH